jgi:hypothetical protein
MRHAQAKKGKAALALRCLRSHAQSRDDLFFVRAPNYGGGWPFSCRRLPFMRDFGFLFPAPH